MPFRFKKTDEGAAPAFTGPFLYEMHQHTARCSACSSEEPAQVVRALKEAGFAGVVLTNHFYHGNTGIRRNVAWQDFVRPYEEAYWQAKEDGAAVGIDVMFGVEEHVGGGKEVLLYGITPAFLYAHPQLRDLGSTPQDLARLADLVHEAGGLMVQAHPFRVRDYIAEPWRTLPPALLDGVETVNACNSPLENARAAVFAEENDLLAVAGSDAHMADFPGRCGIVCAHRITTEAQLAQVLRSGDYELYTG